jgi:hypothetical protein
VLWVAACDDGLSDRSKAEVHKTGRPRESATWYVLVNGGASAQKNYLSHVEHVRQFLDLLQSKRVDESRIAVFASDGTDPAPDVAVLDAENVKGDWLIERLFVDRPLKPEIYLRDAVIAGAPRYPATAVAFDSWLERTGARMREGDTVVIYVTDHGWKNEENLANNAVAMWHERMTVEDLRRRIDRLPDGVRVVLLMSQCFSGGFAATGYSTHSIYSDPDRDVCGYFSSTADRPAYGCYPENRGKRSVGHSFRFIEALRRSPEFPVAHEQVLLTDQTPDVPLRSSDLYLERLLLRGAKGSGRPMQDYADELLGQAWADELHYRHLVERLDEIGRIYGSSSPRSIRAFDAEVRNLPELRGELIAYAQQWEAASIALRRELFDEFLAERSHWSDVAEPGWIDSLDPAATASVRSWLVADFREYAFADDGRRQRLELLRDMSREARAAAYRMEVRRAAAARMRWLLIRIAGMVYVDRIASTDERAAFERLSACEDFSLPADRFVPLGRIRVAEHFPPLATELKIIAAVLPGWFGLQTVPAGSAAAAGAVRVVSVVQGSPAERAGIASGDVILGPPGAHFRSPVDFREWTLTSTVDEARVVDIHRDGRTIRVEMVTAAPPDWRPRGA